MNVGMWILRGGQVRCLPRSHSRITRLGLRPNSRKAPYGDMSLRQLDWAFAPAEAWRRGEAPRESKGGRALEREKRSGREGGNC